MLYILPTDPASPKSSLKALRQIARRAGYLIAADYTTDTFSLVDARLRVPLLGLNHVGLPEIAHAVEVARAKAREAHTRPRSRRRSVDNRKARHRLVRIVDLVRGTP
jgi:hypothetical protein